MQQSNIFDHMYTMRGIKSLYESLRDIEEGRKLVTDDDGKFYESAGYNTGLQRPIQAVSRMISNFFGWNATALGTKDAIEQLNTKAFENLTEMITCFTENCKDSTYLVTCVKVELAAHREMIAQAKESIGRLSSTYELEGDLTMKRTIETEVGRCGEIEKQIDAFLGELKMMRKANAAAIAGVKGGAGAERGVRKCMSQDEGSGAAAVANRALREATPPPPPSQTRRKKTLLELAQDRVQWIPKDHSVAKDNFYTLFTENGRLEELQAIKRYLDPKGDDEGLPEGWDVFIEGLDEKIRAGLVLAMTPVIQAKQQQSASPSADAVDQRGSVLDEIRSVGQSGLRHVESATP